MFYSTLFLFLFLANENLFSYLLHVVLQSCIFNWSRSRNFKVAPAAHIQGNKNRQNTSN